MSKYEYTVLAFRQQKDSPIQVAFVAHAGEILSWAGVPRKSDELLTGYQRFRDSKRIDQEIVPFFQDPQNCSPTAVIVALRRESGIGACTLPGMTGLDVGAIRSATLTIEVDDEALQSDKALEAARRYVEERVGPANATEVDADEEEDDEQEAEALEDLETSDQADEEDGDEEEQEEVAQLGSATLNRMKDLLDDKANWQNPDFRAAIGDYVKPAFLIDGQHRVSAAAKIGLKGLPFIVCGLFDAPWEEQVFQFTVVNLKPKRIPPSLITSIAGLSLTSAEREKVQLRLSRAGVKLVEVEIMSLVAYDAESPFFNRVDMSVRDPKEKAVLLGYGGMKRISSVWHRARRTSFQQVARELYRTRKFKAVKHWREERAWFDFFVVFWRLVSETYADLWEKGEDNHLFTTASLWSLQEAILTEADGQMQSFWKVDKSTDMQEERDKLLRDKLTEVVESTLHLLPTKMWTADSPNWASSDTSGGRSRLRTMLSELIAEGKSTGGPTKKWKSHPWFKTA